jgi:hypothetical protein
MTASEFRHRCAERLRKRVDPPMLLEAVLMHRAPSTTARYRTPGEKRLILARVSAPNAGADEPDS